MEMREGNNKKNTSKICGTEDDYGGAFPVKSSNLVSVSVAVPIVRRLIFY